VDIHIDQDLAELFSMESYVSELRNATQKSEPSMGIYKAQPRHLELENV
jgi:hypothetical protein